MCSRDFCNFVDHSWLHYLSNKTCLWWNSALGIFFELFCVYVCVCACIAANLYHLKSHLAFQTLYFAFGQLHTWIIQIVFGFNKLHFLRSFSVLAWNKLQEFESTFYRDSSWWRLQWLCLIHITALQFHSGKEFHPMDADYVQGRQCKNQQKTCLYTASVVSSKFPKDVAIHFSQNSDFNTRKNIEYGLLTRRHIHIYFQSMEVVGQTNLQCFFLEIFCPKPQC